MAFGDHVYIHRGGYSHHGVDMGGGRVIHFASANGKKGDAVIRWASIDEFAGSGAVEVREYGARFDAQETTMRAQSMVGQSGYDLFANNCEHFATWCTTGEHSSAQVETVASGAGLVGIGVIVPPLGVGVVSALGQAAAMSGPNLMSGLATAGGSVVGGMVLLGGVTGLATGAMMCSALRDSPILPVEERNARRVGRYAAVSGAAVGVGVAVQTIGSLGVAGYSAAGLTSGLAALGGVVGGGMAQGVLMALFLPAVFAAGIGYLLYRLAEWFLAEERGRRPAAEMM